MKRIIFTVYGSPVAQGRARAFVRGKHIGFYDPKKSSDWKNNVKAQVIEQLITGKHGEYRIPPLHTGPIVMDLYFYLPRPKTLAKRYQHHTKKPDRDNLEKAIKDALKGILYRDDSQIFDGRTRKAYGDPPRVVIAIQLVPHDAPFGTSFPLTKECVDGKQIPDL